MDAARLPYLNERITINSTNMLILNNRFRDYPCIVYEYPELTPEPDYWVKRYMKLTRSMPKQWHVQLPARLGEIGFDVNGYPVNRGISMMQERIADMLMLSTTDPVIESTDPRALEIGGGAGKLARTFCQAVPNLTWYNCDLLGSMAFNIMRMAILLPEKRHVIYVGDAELNGVDESLIIRCPKEASTLTKAMVQIPHHLLGDFHENLEIDMACNAWSFAEMPSSAVKRYGRSIASFLRPDAALYEQNEQGIEARGGSSTETIFNESFSHYRKSHHRLWDVLTIRMMSGSTRAWRKDAPAWSLKRIMRQLHYRWILFNGLSLIGARKRFDPKHYERLADVFKPGSMALREVKEANNAPADQSSNVA